MRHRDKVVVSIFALFYLVFGLLITFTQERIIYQPWPQDFETCDAFREAEKVTYNGTRMYVKEGEKRNHAAWRQVSSGRSHPIELERSEQLCRGELTPSPFIRICKTQVCNRNICTT